MKHEKHEKKSSDLVTNPQNYMESFRKNLDILIDDYDYSIRELSEKADMSFETLKSFIYGDAKDCKLSTAVKLSKVFGISIDELVGAGTIDDNSKECLVMSRNMPDYVRYLIRSFIRHQHKIHSRLDPKSINIPVLMPECSNGYLPTTNITSTVCIDHLTNNLKSKVMLGLQIPCEHYEPYYMPNEILLLSADRGALNGEKCVLSYKGNYFIAIKRIYIEDGVKKWKYISIMDVQTEILPNDIDDKYGYVVGFLNPDGTWGVR